MLKTQICVTLPQCVKIFRIEVRIKPLTDPTIVDSLMIFNVKILISISYDINIKGNALLLILVVRNFLILISLLLMGIIAGGGLIHFLKGGGYK